MPTEPMTEEQAQAEWDRMDAEEEGTEGQTLAQTLQTDSPTGLESDAPDEPLDREEAPAKEPPLVESKKQAPTDPLAAVNESIAALARSIEESRRDVRAINGRVGGLADQFKQTKAEASVAKAAAAPGGPSQAEIDAASKDPAEWDTLKGDFPEWATAVEKYVASKVRAPASPAIDIEGLITQKLNTVPQMVQSAIREERQRELQEQRVIAQIETAHPGWTTVAASPEFHAWKATQAPGIRALADSDDPADAIEMLNLYSAVRTPSTSGKTSAQVAAERQKRLNSSVGTSRAQAPGPRATVALADLDDDQLWAYYDRQDEQAEARARR